jgi:hypothetical protein
VDVDVTSSVKLREWKIPGELDDVFGATKIWLFFDLGMEDNVGSVWLGVG